MNAPRKAPAFSIREAIGFGWAVARRNVGFFLLMFVVTSIVDGIPGKIQAATMEHYPLVSLVAGVAAIAVALVTNVGWTKIVLRFADGERPTHADLYAHYRLAFNYGLVNLLYALSVMAGFLLFVIPALLALVRYSLCGFLVVDRGMGPLEAMRKSAELTRGVRWRLFLAGLAVIGIVMLGAMALVIGLLWAIPTATVAIAYIYRRLLAPEAAAVPAPTAPGGPKEWWATKL